MKILECAIAGPLIIEPQIYEDERGFFMESWNAEVFRSKNLNLNFVQDNHSRSNRGVLRGLHFQHPAPQGKLVRVVNGSVWDVVVDLRPDSATYGNWFGIELSATNKRMLWIPEGFAHGFLALEDSTDFLYKCTALYDAKNEYSLRWDDPALSIDWPLGNIEPHLSAKDGLGLSLAEVPVLD